MGLTAQRAVELMRELWQWLAENPGTTKSDWGGWPKYGRMIIGSPCCEYDEECRISCEGSYICCSCPLYGMWVAGDQKSRCFDEGSPFAIWRSASSEEVRRKCALEIVALCERWLKEHTELKTASNEPAEGENTG